MKRIGCGCCVCLPGGSAGVAVNRPGLSALHYRTGAYGPFFDAMIRRLTIPVDDAEPIATYPLHALTTREPDDPAIALLDAWAVVGDVLTFYQERIANEGFLRTATERRSVLELGHLVGYRLKPGVAASVYLAYTLDDTATTLIPPGTKAQSVPGANEQPQMFETSEATEARGPWNALRPRMSRPLDITLDTVLEIESVWIDGTTTRLGPRDPLLFVLERGDKTLIYALRRTLKTNPDLERRRTEVVLEPVRPYYVNLAGAVLDEQRKPPPAGAAADRATALEQLLQYVLLGVPRSTLQAIANVKSIGQGAVTKALEQSDADAAVPPPTAGPTTVDKQFLEPLLKPRGLAPPSRWQFQRSLKTTLAADSDYRPRLLATFYPQLEATLYTAIANIASGNRPYAELRSLHVLRRSGAVFGYNAPAVMFEERPTDQHAQLPNPEFVDEEATVLRLNTPDDAITLGSYVVTSNKRGTRVAKVLEATTGPLTAYGISGQTTRLTLDAKWWDDFRPRPIPTSAVPPDVIGPMKDNLQGIRSTAVLAESEELTLAQRPVVQPIGKVDPRPPGDPETEKRIELDAVVDGLSPGRWVIVSGERLDTTATRGVVSAELAMLDNVEQTTDAGPGGTAYSILVLAGDGLAYTYRRDTVKIFANVVAATHGETRSEILGAGDAARPLQTFTLHHAPLTFVAASTVAGVVSTLAVRVNDVLWREIDSLADASPADRVFVTSTADDGKVSVTFGTGTTGARLPTGPDNVRSVYRSGIGRAGNVKSGQVSTAISRPLGVRDVVNPLAASGGADPESRDDARRHIPVSLQAMGRVVSVQDYADFARTFAGISKASAVALSDGRRRIVHLTVGGEGDIEIDVNSDLYRNLGEAIRRYGDPYQPFLVAPREKIVITGSARVQVHPSYLWTSVAPAIRAALLDTFSYDRRGFGQPVYPAEVVAAIQNVAGVVYVDLDALHGLTAEALLAPPKNNTVPAADLLTLPATNGNRLPAPVAAIVPRPVRHVEQAAQIAFLPPELADLFILTEIVNG